MDETSSQELLKVEGLTKRFGGLVAVKDLSFDMKQGEIVGLIGPNGAGKTTVFNLLSGFYPADEGKVIFKGIDITGRPPHVICEHGLVRTFQIVEPFRGMTALDTVTVGALNRHKRLKDAKKIADKELDYFGISAHRSRLCKDLTIAELRRVEMARAAATEPELFLIDEMVAGLSPVETDNMVDLVKRLRDERGLTICLVEHVMRAVMNVSERIIVINYGEKIAEGAPSVISKDSHVIEAYLGRQVA